MLGKIGPTQKQSVRENTSLLKNKPRYISPISGLLVVAALGTLSLGTLQHDKAKPVTGDPFRITGHRQVREAHNIVQHIQGLHGKRNKVPRNHDKAQTVTGDPFRVTCHWQPREARNV